jgi:hypothetical protein
LNQNIFHVMILKHTSTLAVSRTQEAEHFQSILVGLTKALPYRSVLILQTEKGLPHSPFKVEDNALLGPPLTKPITNTEKLAIVPMA